MIRHSVRHFIGAAALLAAGFSAVSGFAQTDSSADNSSADTSRSADTGRSADTATPRAMPDPTRTIVARIGSQTIYLAEILAMAEQLPEQYRQMPLPAVYPALLQRAVDERLVAAAGRAADYAKKPDVMRRMADAETRIIAELYLADMVAGKVTDAMLRAEYDARKDDLAGGEQVKARHILLESAEDAQAVIAKLDEGEDFATLAEAQSTGPSASKGGDLGWFARAQMVPPFSEAAFALAPGTYTKEPVETRFGWHVILAEERRDGTVPEFDEVRDQLARTVSQGLIGDMLEDLRRDAVVERFNFDGTPMPQAAKQ